MNPLHRSRIIGTAVAMLVVTAAASWPMAARASTRELIVATPSHVALTAPAPGASQTWDMKVTSTTDSPTSLNLEVTGASERLFTGTHPLRLTITDPAGHRVLDTVDIPDVLGARIALPDLPAGASRRMVGTVTLPLAAGNRYEGADGSLRLRFRAQANEAPADSTGPGIALPDTGAPAFLAAAAALAIVTLTAGFVLVVSSKKKENHA